MSIVTLKRKTQVKYNNMSVGQQGFSLNGTRRSAGYVGQDTLGRSLIRSLSDKNGVLKGHGGCCGEYHIGTPITSPEMIGLNDPEVVKASSLGNNGLIMSKYRWIRRPKPFTTWKPDDYLHNGHQSAYINHLRRKTILESCHDTSGNTVQPKCCNDLTTNYLFSTKKLFSRKQIPIITKPASFLSAASQSEHIQTMAKKCVDNDVFYIPKNTKNTSFACGKRDAFTPLFTIQ